MKIAKSVTKTVDLMAPYARVFDYIANIENWPEWAIINMVSAKRKHDGSFHIKTKFGEGSMSIRPNVELGILDHTWTDPQASWTVPCRLVRNAEGCTFIITLFQPPKMNEHQFRNAMSEMDKEMDALGRAAAKLR